VKQIVKKFYSRYRQPIKKLAFVIALSLPVVLYTWKFAITERDGIFGGADWDQFSQMYEAARISIMEYGQFPWWNPWVVGGIPLFANPQFGLFALPTPFVLLFGTVQGLHFAVMAYFLIGFWSMFLLLQRLRANNTLMHVLLAYIWVFSGFATLRIFGGHLTFAVYLLAPLLFLCLLNIERKRWWLWLALSASLLVHTAPHYLTIEALLICVPIALLRLNRSYKAKPKLGLLTHWRPYLYALGAFAVLSGAKLYYTLQYLHDYPRVIGLDPPVDLKIFFGSLIFREPIDPISFAGEPYGWVEYGNYIGIVTLMLFSYLVFRKFENIKNITQRDWILLFGIVLFALLSLGSFAIFSPFTILHIFPIFDQMRVPSRFICWLTFALILFLSQLPKTKIIYIALIVSAIDVFAANYATLNLNDQKPYKDQQPKSTQFEQYEFYDTDPKLGQIGILSINDLRLFKATQNNYGEVYGYEPVLNVGEYYFSPGTKRCGINKGCSFILTGNAQLKEWTPHRITIERTSDGPIKLNMNPGSVWNINGKDVFKDYNVLELTKDFEITDTSKTIVISFSTKPSIL
jgi:hypothetical protein